MKKSATPRTSVEEQRLANEGGLETYSLTQQGLIGLGDEEAPTAETNPARSPQLAISNAWLIAWLVLACIGPVLRGGGFVVVGFPQHRFFGLM